MSHDFTAQEIAFNMFMNDTIKSGNLLWNWGIDLGGNFLEAFSFYNAGSIFFLFSLLFPAKMIPHIMECILMLKFAVAGAASAAYFERHIQNKVIIIMASILYAFSGFQCASVVFCHFQDAVALFPLLVPGLENLVEDKKRGRLAIACLMNVLCNYVFFAGEVIFLVIYYVIKYLIPDIRAGSKKSQTVIAPILHCMAEGAIGMAMAGILLVHFKAVINSDSEKYAFFSVSYDASWKAQVNGADEDVLNINGLMAVKVTEGSNEILFHYRYKPIILGLGCSIGGSLLFIGYMIIFCRKRNLVAKS